MSFQLRLTWLSCGNIYSILSYTSFTILIFVFLLCPIGFFILYQLIGLRLVVFLGLNLLTAWNGCVLLYFFGVFFFVFFFHFFKQVRGERFFFPFCWSESVLFFPNSRTGLFLRSFFFPFCCHSESGHEQVFFFSNSRTGLYLDLMFFCGFRFAGVI